MRKGWSVILIVALASIIMQPAWAEEPKAPIKVKKTALGSQYLYKGRALHLFAATRVVADCPEALAKIRTAQMTYVPAMLFSGIGGALLGTYAGEAITGQDPSWAIAAAGGVSVGAGLGLAALSGALARKGFAVYNESLGYASASRAPSVQLAFSPQSVGVRMRF